MGEQFFHFQSANGELWVTLHGGGVASSRMTGYCDLGMTLHLMGPLDRLMIAGQRLKAFHDWEEVTSYDTRCRIQLTTWGVRFRNQIDCVNILTRSKVVTMGVTVATIVLPGMVRVFAKREEFQIALATAIANEPRTNTPPPPPLSSTSLSNPTKANVPIAPKSAPSSQSGLKVKASASKSNSPAKTPSAKSSGPPKS
jgi:hypothetical protein